MYFSMARIIVFLILLLVQGINMSTLDAGIQADKIEDQNYKATSNGDR